MSNSQVSVECRHWGIHARVCGLQVSGSMNCVCGRRCCRQFITWRRRAWGTRDQSPVKHKTTWTVSNESSLCLLSAANEFDMYAFLCRIHGIQKSANYMCKVTHTRTHTHTTHTHARTHTHSLSLPFPSLLSLSLSSSSCCRRGCLFVDGLRTSQRLALKTKDKKWALKNTVSPHNCCHLSHFRLFHCRWVPAILRTFAFWFAEDLKLTPRKISKKVSCNICGDQCVQNGYW